MTNLDSKPTAAYLKDNIDFKQLHIKVDGQKVDEQTGSYSFYFTDKFTGDKYYLHLGESNMFSKNETNLTVSVTGESYKIVNSEGKGRMLDLNVVGDDKSGQFSGENYITDFWGPRPADNTNFKIYLKW